MNDLGNKLPQCKKCLVPNLAPFRPDPIGLTPVERSGNFESADRPPIAKYGTTYQRPILGFR
jgi:hypothetical protein